MDLTVARAVFLSALLRSGQEPGVPDIRRDDANVFPKTIHRALNICTSTNIKACKAFIVRYILPSAARTAALTKYLCTVAKACTPTTNNTSRMNNDLEGLEELIDGRSRQPPEPIFRRLHALYIVHDVLAYITLRLRKDQDHATAFTINDNALESLQHAVPVLAQLSVCADCKPSRASKQAFDTVQDMLSSWEQHNMLPIPITSELHASLSEASTKTFSDQLASLADEEAQATLQAQRAKEESSKWIVPKTHGVPNDMSAPWHDLPAANGLFQKRTQGYPLRAAAFPRGGYSLQNAGRRADDSMQVEVEGLLAEAKRCFDKYTDASEVQDIDPLGNIIWKPSTGRKTRTHWGWSYDGIARRRRSVDDHDD